MPAVDVHILGVMSGHLYSAVSFVFVRHLTFLLLRLSTTQFTVLEGTTQSMVSWGEGREGTFQRAEETELLMGCILIS